MEHPHLAQAFDSSSRSYTPSRISIRIGTAHHDLQEALSLGKALFFLRTKDSFKIFSWFESIFWVSTAFSSLIPYPHRSHGAWTIFWVSPASPAWVWGGATIRIERTRWSLGVARMEMFLLMFSWKVLDVNAKSLKLHISVGVFEEI